jgi:alpha-L-fucosidase 2
MHFNLKEANNYSRTLDISRGVVTVSMQADETSYTREYFVSHPDQLMFIKLSSKGKNKMNVELTMNSLLRYKLVLHPPLQSPVTAATYPMQCNMTVPTPCVFQEW